MPLETPEIANNTIIPVVSTQSDDIPLLTMKECTTMTPIECREYIGNAMYKALTDIYPEEVGKIVGLLLSLDLSEQIQLYNSPIHLINRA
jgi:hypothetical protein